MQSLARLSDVYLPNTSFIFMTKDDMYFHVKSKYIVLIWGLTRMLPVPVLKRKDSLLTTSSTKFVTGTPSSCRIRVYQTWKLKYQNTTVRCWRLVLQWMLMEDLVTVEKSPTARYPTSAALTRRASSTSPGLSGTTMVTSRATLGWLVTHLKHDGDDTSPTLTTEKNAEAQSRPVTFGNWKTPTSPTPSPGTSSGRAQSYNPVTKHADCAVCTLEKFFILYHPKQA